MNTGPGSYKVAKTLADKYVPTPAGEPYKTIVFGDQGTVERLIQARRVAGDEQSKQNRMIGIEPAGQDFHKRGIYNQVVSDKQFHIIFVCT